VPAPSPLAWASQAIGWRSVFGEAGHAQMDCDGRQLGNHSILVTLALASEPPIWLPIGAILGIGFFSASSTMLMTHGRGTVPDRLIGRGVATINTAVMLGVACMQTFSEIVVGAFEPLADGARSQTAYRTSA